jgi:hypothetical protein
MVFAAKKSSVAGTFGESFGRAATMLAKMVSFPIAVVFALVGQFAFGWLVMMLTPPPDPTSPGKTESAVWALALLLLLQGAALVFAVSREKPRPSRVYFSIAAMVWAVASMLLVYVALECDLSGVCL